VNTDYRRFRNKRRGILTFEWILLITVLVIGVVGGASAVRDAIVSEMGDVVGAAVAVDQSYSVTSLTIPGTPAVTLGNTFHFSDTRPATSQRRFPNAVADQDTIGPCED
jgi:hypothetical protein